MPFYRDLTTRINSSGISIRGLPIPIISAVSLTWDEVEGIDRVDCSMLDRLRLAGPSTRDTWWSFDPLRWTHAQGMKIRLVHPEFGFKNIILTLSDLDCALRVAHEYLGQKAAEGR